MTRPASPPPGAPPPDAAPAPLAPDSGVPRDDHRPPGAPRAGIAPGQIDVEAALAATHDAAGEPLPPVEERIAQGLLATEPTRQTPKPGSADTQPLDHRTFDGDGRTAEDGRE